MKILIPTTSAGRKLGLITPLITLLGGFAAGAAPAVLVNEAFDPPTLDLTAPNLLWQDNVNSVTRQYVSSGVNGSMAMQMSADLLPNGYAGLVFYQNGLVFGNDLATTQNTVLSFDVKVDQPGLDYLRFGLQSWSGFIWNSLAPGLATSSSGPIPLGAYVPGQFKTITVAMNDPLWSQDTYGSWDGPFDPSGKTYQILVQVEAGALPAPGLVTFTVDNVRVTTRNPMVPWRYASSGQVAAYDPDTGAATLNETGIAEHLGNFTATVTASPVEWGYAGTIVITAADGAQLFGSICGVPSVQMGIVIEHGTRRFQGARGSYLAEYNWTSESSYTATSTGRISNVGFSQ